MREHWRLPGKQMKRNTQTKSLLFWTQLLICLSLALSVTFLGWQFLFRYNLEYNEMGRYFDEEESVVYHEQAILSYGFLFFIWL